MKRALLLIGTIAISSLGMQTQAQQSPSLYTLCFQKVQEMDYKEQYEKGKWHAEAWQTALMQKDLTEEKRLFDNTRYTSQHGTGGMTDGVMILIGMLYAKSDNEPYSVNSRASKCLMGEFRIYSEQPWSGVHQGFVENLSPELKALYWSLPTQ